MGARLREDQLRLHIWHAGEMLRLIIFGPMEIGGIVTCTKALTGDHRSIATSLDMVVVA